MKSKLLANITPGEILAEDFLKPMGLSQYRLAMGRWGQLLAMGSTLGT